MKNLKVVLCYEIKRYISNKIFAGITLLLALSIILVIFSPRVINNYLELDNVQNSDKAVMLISINERYKNDIREIFSSNFQNYKIVIEEKSEVEICDLVSAGDIECALKITDLTNYVYYVKDLVINDNNVVIVDQILKNYYEVIRMSEIGIDLKLVNEIKNVEIMHEIECIGKNQTNTFYYTYMMLLILYIVIFLYGNMIATGVAEEKGGRIMELLITSAKPIDLLLGKIIAACLVGLGQLMIIFGTTVVAYHVNRNYWEENYLVSQILDVPLEILVYMLIFFVLGFLCYAFIFGAVGSMVSKSEELSIALMPVYVIFIGSFIIVLLSMLKNANGILLKICSFIPITSPIAMFIRVAMSNVSLFEIFICILSILVFIIVIGIISAKIYEKGVMSYQHSVLLDYLKQVKRKKVK